MTQTHSIIPPSELVKQWEINATLNRKAASLWTTAFAAEAAQWGADQELKACCEWVDWKWSGIRSRDLRAARRPLGAAMTQLSSAAQEIMVAATNGNFNVVNDPVYKQCIAAALRAAADSINHATSAHTLHAIADELEALND